MLLETSQQTAAMCLDPDRSCQASAALIKTLLGGDESIKARRSRLHKQQVLAWRLNPDVLFRRRGETSFLQPEAEAESPDFHSAALDSS